MNQLISLAVDQTEQQLIEGRAPGVVVSQLIKMATVKEQLELEKLRRENELLSEKTKSAKSSQHMEELTQRVLSALKRYSGSGDEDDPEIF